MPIEGGDRLEHYYHHLFTTDREIVALYEELGLGDQIEWLPSSMAIFRDGASHPFTSPLDLLRFKPMSLLGRLRMGAGALAIQRSRKGSESFDDVTARALVERLMGPEAWRVVWGPLMEGKFAGRSEQISGAWLHNKLNLRRRIDGREAGGEQLGYPRGGWQPLLDRLEQEITEARRPSPDRPPRARARPRRRRPAAGLVRRAGLVPRRHRPQRLRRRRRRQLRLGPRHRPLPHLHRDARPGPPRRARAAYLDRVDGAEYGTAICLLLELDRSFGPYYWTNIADPEIPFIGLIEQGNLVGTERYGGRHFLYVANYVLAGDPLIHLDTDGLLEHTSPPCGSVQPAFDRSWVRDARVYREARPSQSSPPATASGSRRCRPRPRVSSSPTRPRSTPKTEAPTTASA